MKNISFAPVRALYMSTDDEWTRDHPEKVWEEARMDSLLAIGPANLSEEQIDSLSESEALHLILSSPDASDILAQHQKDGFAFFPSKDRLFRDALELMIDKLVFPESDLPATTAGTLMNVLRGGSLREQEARSELDNIMAFILKAGLMSSRAIARSTGIAYNTVLRRAQGADEGVTNKLVGDYHFYAAEEGDYSIPEDPTEASESEQDILDRLAELGEIRESAEREIESLSRDLISRGVPHQVIANAARVHRVTVTRWKKSMKEGN